MTLWIRTQDKLQLLAVDSLLVDDKQILTFVPMYKILGEYATRERALEVLDEIQRILTPRIIISSSVQKNELDIDEKYEFLAVGNGIEPKVVESACIVYEMPKE